MDQTERIVLVCGVFIIICLIIVVAGIRQDKKIPFQIQKRYLSDGSVQLEVLRFHEKNKEIMDKFYQIYSVGNIIFLGDQEFVISDMKKTRIDTLFSSQYVMNIYLEEEKWKCEYEHIFNTIVGLLTDDPEVLNELSDCFSDSTEYYHKYPQEFGGLDSPASPKVIAWYAIINCLANKELILLFDVKTDMELFLQGMRLLAERKELAIEDSWFPPSDGYCYVAHWCAILDERWSKQGFVVAAFDIDSDSYAVFVCKQSDYVKLQCLARKVNQRFALAKDM